MVNPKPQPDINARTALINKLWFSVLGLAIFFMFLYSLEFYFSLFSGKAVDLCRIDSGWGCRESISHPWSKFLWLPVSIWAMACYSLLLALNPGHWQDIFCRRLAAFVVGLQVIVSIIFIYIIWRDFTELCPLCTAGHIANLLLLVIFLSASRLQFPQPSAPHNILKLTRLPITILLLGYILQGWTTAVSQQTSLQTAITQTMLLKSVVLGDYERYNLETDYQLIKGQKDAPHRMTVVGSLACSHCRQLLRQIHKLPDTISDKVSIWFVPYPLSELCNPRISKSDNYEKAKCVMAAQTQENQITANFWPWFMTVDKQPGRTIREAGVLYDGEKIRQQLSEQITRTNATGINSIPRLFWDGQQLPDIFKKVQLKILLINLVKIMESQAGEDEQPEDCGC